MRQFTSLPPSAARWICLYASPRTRKSSTSLKKRKKNNGWKYICGHFRNFVFASIWFFFFFSFSFFSGGSGGYAVLHAASGRLFTDPGDNGQKKIEILYTLYIRKLGPGSVQLLRGCEINSSWSTSLLLGIYVYIIIYRNVICEQNVFVPINGCWWVRVLFSTCTKYISLRFILNGRGGGAKRKKKRKENPPPILLPRCRFEFQISIRTRVDWPPVRADDTFGGRRTHPAHDETDIIIWKVLRL